MATREVDRRRVDLASVTVWLRHAPAAMWADLLQLETSNWLWTDFDGLHVDSRLPATRPADVTHLWGWSERSCFRVRVDADLAVDADCAWSKIDFQAPPPGTEALERPAQRMNSPVINGEEAHLLQPDGPATRLGDGLEVYRVFVFESGALSQLNFVKASQL